MSRRVAALLVGVALAASCTERPPQPERTVSPSEAPASPTTGRAVELLIVSGRGTAPYLEGMEVAVRQVNSSGGVAGRPLRLRPAAGLEALTAPNAPPAAVVVGRGDRVVRLRPAISSAGAPVVVLGDDLYSSRQLFREAFQASVPELWQARALARLLMRDLRLTSVALVSRDRDTTAAYRAAMAEEGAALRLVDLAAPRAIAREVAGADAAILPGRAEEIEALAETLTRLDDPPLLALSSEGLSVGAELPVGTVAPYHYAWSGWAEPIPRVARFRRRFERIEGEVPEALQQEGYDAVRVLAEALDRTDGRGGDDLIRALEAVREDTYSSLPLRLGPDDHVLLPEGQLGVFAVARPETEAPGEALTSNRWRPVMRTFTYNGERVTIARRDLRVFFPRWRYPAPTPEYRRARFGITSPAGTPPR